MAERNGLNMERKVDKEVVNKMEVIKGWHRSRKKGPIAMTTKGGAFRLQLVYQAKNKQGIEKLKQQN